MKQVLLAFVMLIIFQQGFTQSYIIRFTNKKGTPYTLSQPSAYLSQRAIERRTRYAIAIDSTDLPITPAYIDSLKAIPGVTFLNASKWLNQVSVKVTDANALVKIRNFSFVQSANYISARLMDAEAKDGGRLKEQAAKNSAARLMQNFYNYGSAYNQVHIHNGEFLHNIGLRGQNIQIGMLDAGYNKYTTLKAFDSIRSNGQILDTWDFVSREASVAENHAHGMYCLSIIAANIPGSFVGTAPKASFMLYRTENEATEYPIEEHNWVCGAERVDSTGGDLISSSLGYTTFDDASFDHTYADLDGNKTIAAKGADLAAKKGILVFNAAGNEGDGAWKFLSTPADGDSVLAVAAVNASGQPANFSSYGPSADGQVKPDIASVGVSTVIQLTNNNIGTGNGTSFACPNIAGLAACLWQGFREFNNMKIIKALQQSGSIANNPDNRIGYGIPDMKKAVMLLLKDYAESSATIDGCRTQITWKSKDASGMRYDVERKAPGANNFEKVYSVPATSGTFQTHLYSFTDSLKNISSGSVSYRILQVVDTAQSTYAAQYIDSFAVNLTTSCTVSNTLSLYPNPAHTQIIVKAAYEKSIQNLQMVIYNAEGKRVMLEKRNKPAGVYNYPLHIQHLSSGKYFLSMYDDNTLITTKEFIKL